MWKKKSRPYDELKPFAPLKCELNIFFQHFQAWEWVEYSDFFQLLKVNLDFKAISKVFDAVFAPQISFCKVVRYLESVSNKKAKPYDV